MSGIEGEIGVANLAALHVATFAAYEKQMVWERAVIPPPRQCEGHKTKYDNLEADAANDDLFWQKW